MISSPQQTMCLLLQPEQQIQQVALLEGALLEQGSGSVSSNPMLSPEGLQRQGSSSKVLTWTKMCLPVIHFGILPPFDQQPKWGSVG
jgi:hypothetical protein